MSTLQYSPIKTNVSESRGSSTFSNTYLVVTIVVIVVAFICISIFTMYKINDVKAKNKNTNEMEKDG